ncbi:MAG: hypothetical protein ACE5IR_06795 [bacterium]
MSTQEVISNIQSLPFSEQLKVMEEILKLIRKNMNTIKKINEVDKKRNDIRLRRKSFKIKAFDLGGDIAVDRDELYFERGT